MPALCDLLDDQMHSILHCLMMCYARHPYFRITQSAQCHDCLFVSFILLSLQLQLSLPAELTTYIWKPGTPLLYRRPPEYQTPDRLSYSLIQQFELAGNANLPSHSPAAIFTRRAVSRQLLPLICSYLPSQSPDVFHHYGGYPTDRAAPQETHNEETQRLAVF